MDDLLAADATVVEPSFLGDRGGTSLAVGQILGQLDDEVRAGALALSTAGTFDAEMAQELIGIDTGRVVAELQRCHLVVHAEHGGQWHLGFPPEFRDVLQRELRWRDPSTYDDLHRRAAKIHQRRNEYGEAYEHLMAIGDAAAADELIILPTLQFVDRGDRAGLAQMLTTLRSPMNVASPGLALDLAMSAFFAGSGVDAALWCDRAERLGARDDGSLELRLHSTRGILALMNGELDVAVDCAAAHLELEQRVSVDGPMVQRFATVAARIALVRRDITEAVAWLQRARLIADPPTVARVTVPGLHAWFDLMVGRLDHAHRLLGPALDFVEAAGMRPHQGVFDAIVTAAWVHYVEGDLPTAMEYAHAAIADAEELGYDWNRIRAAVIMARIRNVIDGPSAAAATIRDARARISHTATPLARQLDRVDAVTRARRGDLVGAEALLDHEDGTPSGRLTRAAVALAAGRAHEVGGLVADDGTWLPAERIEGRILQAVAERGGEAVRLMRDALEEAADLGIVAPFLGQDHRVAELVLRAPLDRVHPRVTTMLRAGSAPAALPSRRLTEPLTARELSILELLPTHLSYAQMGEALYVSVNTVKSNIKSVYRKFGATTRSDAVAAGRAAGLI